MTAIAYHNILVQGPLTFQSITSISGRIMQNRHGELNLEGYLSEETAPQELSWELSGRDICLTASGEPEDLTIFKGKIDHVEVRREGELYCCKVTALTASSVLDHEKKSRSYQNISKTYGEVVREVLQDTPGAWVSFGACEDKAIGRPQIQYEETDWEFIQRLASQEGTTLSPDCRSGKPGFSFGPVFQGKPLTLNSPDYKVGISERYYELGGSEAGWQKAAFLHYLVRTYQALPIGNPVCFNGTELMVCGCQFQMTDGLLVFTYTLGRKPLLCERLKYNQRLPGLSLEGKVLERSGELVTVALDIDKGRESGAYPYPWSPASGNIMYCMPETGTKVTLYFPDYEAGNAIAITSPRKSDAACRVPQNRGLTTAHGKQMYLYPQSMGLRAGRKGDPKGLQVLLDDVNCLLIESSSRTEITAGSTISLSAPTVTLNTPQELQAIQGGSKGITLQNQFDALGDLSVLYGTITHAYPPFEDTPTSVRRDILTKRAIGSLATFGKYKDKSSFIKRAVGSRPDTAVPRPERHDGGLAWLLGALAVGGTAILGGIIKAGQTVAGAVLTAGSLIKNGVISAVSGLKSAVTSLVDMAINNPVVQVVERAGMSLVGLIGGNIEDSLAYIDRQIGLFVDYCKDGFGILDPQRSFAYAVDNTKNFGQWIGDTAENLDDAFHEITGDGATGDNGIELPSPTVEYDTTISWQGHQIPVRKDGAGYWGPRVAQADPRVNAYELKINPNDESYYLLLDDGTAVQFEGVNQTTVLDGKLILQPNKSIYNLMEKPSFLLKKILAEVKRQVRAAELAGYNIQWLVSNENTANQIRQYFKLHNINIEVIYYPE